MRAREKSSTCCPTAFKWSPAMQADTTPDTPSTISGKKFVLQLTPCGILRQESQAVIGNSIVLDPFGLMKEVDMLRSARLEVWGPGDRGASANLFVSNRARVIAHRVDRTGAEIPRPRQDRRTAASAPPTRTKWPAADSASPTCSTRNCSRSTRSATPARKRTPSPTPSSTARPSTPTRCMRSLHCRPHRALRGRHRPAAQPCHGRQQACSV